MKTKHVSEKTGPFQTALQSKYLTATAIGKIIGVTPQTINNWRCKGLIQASIEVEDTVRYDSDDVLSALDAITTQTRISRLLAKLDNLRSSVVEPSSPTAQLEFDFVQAMPNEVSPNNVPPGLKI